MKSKTIIIIAIIALIIQSCATTGDVSLAHSNRMDRNHTCAAYR